MVHKVPENLDEIAEYTPKWKDAMEGRIKGVMGGDGAEITTEKMHAVYNLLHTEGVKHLVENYYKGDLSALPEQQKTALMYLAHQALPDWEAIQAEFATRSVVDSKSLDDWVESIRANMENRLSSQPLSKFLFHPVEESKEALKAWTGKYGMKPNLDAIVEPQHALQHAQQVLPVHRAVAEYNRRQRPYQPPEGED